MTLENQSPTGQLDILVAYLEQFPGAPEPDLLNMVSKEELQVAVERGVIELREDAAGTTYSIPQRPAAAQATRRGRVSQRESGKSASAQAENRPPEDHYEQAEAPEVVREKRTHRGGLLGYLDQVRCGEYWELLQLGFSPEEMLEARRNNTVVAGFSPVSHRLLLAPADERYSDELIVNEFGEDLPYALSALYNNRKVVAPVSYSTIPIMFVYEMTTHRHALAKTSP